jgi:hypothetical protein
LVAFRTLRPSSADAHGVAGKELAIAVEQGNTPAVALEQSRLPRFDVTALRSKLHELRYQSRLPLRGLRRRNQLFALLLDVLPIVDFGRRKH